MDISIRFIAIVRKVLQVPIVLSSLIHERLPSVVQKNGMEAYLKLSHVTEERQRAWALQDAVVEVMPAALRDTFIQVNDEFLKKDVVRRPAHPQELRILTESASMNELCFVHCRIVAQQQQLLLCADHRSSQPMLETASHSQT